MQLPMSLLLGRHLLLGLPIGFFPRFWRDSRSHWNLALLAEVKYIFQSCFTGYIGTEGG